MVDWDKIRDDFPAATNSTYFISAGMSPIPNPVFEKLVKGYRRLNEHGDVNWKIDLLKNRDLKDRVAKLINASSGDVTFAHNTSTAMSILALSLKRALGDCFNVISMMDEFPSTTVPFEYQGIRMKYVNPVNDRYPIDDILKQIDGDTRAVLTSYVQYATGFRQDLLKLGEALKGRDLLFIVNSTQGFPFFPIDVKGMGIDAMSASLHKWGFVGSAGAIFYTSQKFRDRFPPPVAGWLSVIPGEGDFIYTEKNHPIRVFDSADRYNLGTFNLQAANAFEASLDYLDAIGYENIRSRIFELTDRLISGLQKIGAEIRSPVSDRSERSAAISVKVGDKTGECASYLNDKKIHVSFRGGNIRISVNIFNNDEDIGRLISVIEDFLQ